MYVIPSMLSGYGCVEKQVSVSASHTENFSLDTKPAGIITGVIRNARDGTPVDSVRINALISGSDEIITTTATSSDGKYILTIATTGIYDLKLAKYWFGDKKQPRIFVYPERVTEQNLLLYFDISDEQKQKIYDFIEKLRVRIDTSTIATEIANLVVEIKLLEILPKLADWLTEAQIPVYLTEIGKVLDVCKDKIDLHKLVDIDTTTIVAEINKIIQKWNQEELTNIYYSLLDNTTFYFGGKPVHPWVMKQEGWKPNFVEFYTSASPESYTFDGLFPEGVPQKIIDILTPDLTPDFKLVLNSKVSQEQLEDYILNTVKPNCQTKLQTEPENPEANFILAVIEFYEFLKRHQETYSKIYTAISSGNIAGAYQIYISTDIENQLRKIKARLYKVKQAGHFWLTFVVSHELDENPFEINPTETEVTPYPIPAEIVNILISFVDCIEAIINSFSSLAKQFVEGPYIFDLDPNKLDFSTAKEPLDYINALRTANPDFLKLKTLEKDGVDGNAIMSKLKRQLILNAEIYKNTLNGLKLIVKSLAPEYGTYDRLSGFDKQIKYAEQVLDDLRNPAKYVVIDGKKVNISAWFDNPPTNMLDTIENYINGTDPTFGGLFITAGYGIVSGKVSVEEKGIKDALVKAIETTQNKEYSDLTDEDGFYLLTLPEGNYKLSISKTGYPTEEKNVSVISEEVVTVNFTLSPEKYSIKGRVVDNKGAGISAVKIKLNSVKEVVTDENGYYEFKDVIEGEYTITPEKTNWTFQPVSTTVYVSQNLENINFIGTYQLAETETPTLVDIPIGTGGTSVTVEMPERPNEAKIIVGEVEKPKELRGTVKPGETVGIIFKPNLKEYKECVNKEYKIIIFNLAGEVVYEETKIPKTPDDTWTKWIPENLPSGTYIISVSGPGVKTLKKIAILK